MNSVKANDRSLTGTNAVSTVGDESRAVKDIEASIGVTVTEADVVAMNAEIGLGRYSRTAAKLYAALSLGVNYLMVRKN